MVGNAHKAASTRCAMDLRVKVHHEDDSYWAEVVELPGCFASGDTFDELLESPEEAIALYLEDAGPVPSRGGISVAEITVATAAVEPQPA